MTDQFSGNAGASGQLYGFYSQGSFGAGAASTFGRFNFTTELVMTDSAGAAGLIASSAATYDGEPLDTSDGLVRCVGFESVTASDSSDGTVTADMNGAAEEPLSATDSSSSIRSKDGKSRNPGGKRGVAYSVGGYMFDGAGNVLTGTIYSLNMTSEAVASVSDQLPVPRLGSGCLSGDKVGYFVAGQNLGGTLSSVDALKFSNETTYQVSGATSNSAANWQRGFNTPNTGYLAALFTDYVSFATFNFSSETLSSYSAIVFHYDLSIPVQSDTAAYWGGRYDIYQPYSCTDQIQKNVFGTQTFSNISATLSVPAYNMEKVNGREDGFWFYGSYGLSIHYASAINFSTETAFNPTECYPMSYESTAEGRCSDSSYLMGAYNNTTSTPITTIRRYDYEAWATSNISATLPATRWNNMAVSSSRPGLVDEVTPQHDKQGIGEASESAALRATQSAAAIQEATESATATDTKDGSAQATQNQSESASPADSETVVAVFVDAQSESATSTDGKTVTAVFVSSGSEAATGGDAPSSVAVFPVADSEAVSSSTSDSILVTQNVAGSEAGSSDDAKTVIYAAVAAKSEPLTSDTTQTVTAAFVSSDTEPGSANDAPTTTMVAPVAGTATGSAGESDDATWITSAARSEPTTSDHANTMVMVAPVADTESATAGDSETVQTAFVSAGSEAGSGSSQQTVIATMPVADSEAATSGDAPSAIATFPTAITEAGAADSTQDGSKFSIYSVDRSEALSLGETASAVAVFVGAFTADAAASESQDGSMSTQTFSVSRDETLTAAESASTLAVFVSANAESATSDAAFNGVLVQPAAGADAGSAASTQNGIYSPQVAQAESATAVSSQDGWAIYPASRTEAASATATHDRLLTLAADAAEQAAADSTQSVLAVLMASSAEAGAGIDATSAAQVFVVMGSADALADAAADSGLALTSWISELCAALATTDGAVFSNLYIKTLHIFVQTAEPRLFVATRKQAIDTATAEQKIDAATSTWRIDTEK